MATTAQRCRVLLVVVLLAGAVHAGLADPVAGSNSIAYGRVLEFGSPGTGNGQFGHVRDVADDGAGNVYTVDDELDRVQKFTDDGTFLTSWNHTCIRCFPNLLNGPTSVAANATSVWVADTLNGRIVQYSPSGAFVRRVVSPPAGQPGAFGQPTGIALDGSGRVYVVGTADTEVHRFNANGTWSTDFAVPSSGSGAAVEVDGAGNVYVATVQPPRVTKLSSVGTLQGQIDLFSLGIPLVPSGITVDPTNGHALVTTNGTGTTAFTVVDVGAALNGITFVSPTVIGGSINLGASFGLDADADGYVYLGEAGLDRVTKIGRLASLTLVFNADSTVRWTGPSR
jgi:sugar lactone lactonase YvrE